MVLFGGKSVEHDVSIITGYQAISMLDDHEIFPVYVTKNNDLLLVKNLGINDFKNEKFVLKKGKKIKLRKKGFNHIDIDAAVVCMHGTNGEDGLMAALLEFYSIPFTSSSHISAGACQDKSVMKSIFKANDIPIIPYEILYDCDFIDGRYGNIDVPCIIKPANLGSSVGIKVCHTYEELTKGLQDAFRFDSKVIIEKYIKDFREINCAFIGDYELQTESRIEEVVKTKEMLDYEDKYDSKVSGSKRIIPARLDDKLCDEIITLGKKVIKVLDASGVCRIDYILSDGKIYVNEINTIPGSLSNYLFEPNDKLMNQLLKLAFKKYYHSLQKTYAFKANILNYNSLKK